MTKEEFLELASKKWDSLQTEKQTSNNLYEYEKNFDKLWVEFGRLSFEGSLGKVSSDRRKKKVFKSLRKDKP